MAASYQSKDSAVLSQQLKVQELVLRADNSLISVSGGDLSVAIGESVGQVLSSTKQIAAGTLSGVVASASTTTITIVGEAAAAATTVYVLKYVIAENN